MQVESADRPATHTTGAARTTVLWALGVIFAANFFNYMDRQLVSAMEKQLEEAFSLTGRQFGLLWTLFTIGYMVCAIPIGFLADRYTRTKLFAACILIWSAATIATGLATWRPILYAARVFIGVGEAGCLVIGPALISDYFSRNARGRALAWFYLGMPLGGTAAYILASFLLQAGYPWRLLFHLAGWPGLLIAYCILTLKEPTRGSHEEGAHSHKMHGSFADYLQLFRNRTLLLIILAQAFAVIMLVPLLHFGKKFFIDKHQMSELNAGLAIGMMGLVGGALGNLLSGWIGDRLARRSKGAYALLAGFGFLAGWPCLLVGFRAEELWVFLPALTLGCFFYFLCMPAVNTQIANVVSSSKRATAWALAVFILHLLGDTLAPFVFGGVNDYLGRTKPMPAIVAQQVAAGASVASQPLGIPSLVPEMVSVRVLRHHFMAEARATAFSIFSCAMVLAGLTCLLASRTAARDIDRLGLTPQADVAESAAAPPVVENGEIQAS